MLAKENSASGTGVTGTFDLVVQFSLQSGEPIGDTSLGKGASGTDGTSGFIGKDGLYCGCGFCEGACNVCCGACEFCCGACGLPLIDGI